MAVTGLLHLTIANGENIAHAWQDAFKKRQANKGKLARCFTKIPIGCDSPDLCFGLADPFVVVEIHYPNPQWKRLQAQKATKANVPTPQTSEGVDDVTAVVQTVDGVYAGAKITKNALKENVGFKNVNGLNVKTKLFRGEDDLLINGPMVMSAVAAADSRCNSPNNASNLGVVETEIIQVVARSPTINNNHWPQWNHDFSFVIDVDDDMIEESYLVFKVFDDDFGDSFNDLLGFGYCKLANVISNDSKAKETDLAIRIFHPDSGIGGHDVKGGEVVGTRVHDALDNASISKLTVSELKEMCATLWKQDDTTDHVDGNKRDVSKAFPSWLDTANQKVKSHLHKEDASKLNITAKHFPHMLPESRGLDGRKTATPFLQDTNLSVPYSYFRRSHGNVVKLYGDAHCMEYLMETPELHGHQHNNCWLDVYTNIYTATQLVYVAGWSVNPHIRLVRHTDRELTTLDDGSVIDIDFTMTIGELLKMKAEQSVHVVVMVWDDVTSSETLGGAGIMGTYDEVTRSFFKNSLVNVVVAKRNVVDDYGEIPDLIKWTSFTHHQKIILFDTSVKPMSKRVLGSYIGGLDLTTGRYDTPAHSVFHTKKTVHKHDHYNGCLPDAGSMTEKMVDPHNPDKTIDVCVGPREPWHDVHAKIVGPAAFDILETYLERMQLQAPHFAAHTCKYSVDLVTEGKLKAGNLTLVSTATGWDVQVFRSLDSKAANLRNKKFTQRFLGRNQVDRGIQEAYCFQIDQTQGFIYIENQYFLGSAQFWQSEALRQIPCHHMIPYKLAKRICRAIRAGQRFCVYALLPLFPEGVPTSGSVQEILWWQYNTVSFMYRMIADEIASVRSGKDLHAIKALENVSLLDFLQFFFIGQREANTVVPIVSKANNYEFNDCLTYKRHSIYVHSKMAIFDDQYVIMGSANINERSMNGARDTEIAFGAVEVPHRTYSNASVDGAQGAGTLDIRYAKGDVSKFRRSLWSEHLGLWNPVFDSPHSLACTQETQRRARENLAAYTNIERQMDLPHGHLCAYPYEIRETGEVFGLWTGISGSPPDVVKGNLPGLSVAAVGVKSSMLPTTMTT